jgi:hypothetical protein
MVDQQTIERLKEMSLETMAENLRSQGNDPAFNALSFDERLGLLVDAEWSTRRSKKLARLIRSAGLHFPYLFGLTGNRQHRHIEIDALRLSDTAIAILKSDKLNNRLVSEIIAHPDFPKLLSAVEVYIDRKVLPQMNTMNAMYKIAEDAIKEKFEVTDSDEIISLLQEAVVDEDEYLRYRISERFNSLVKNLFDAHKKDALPDEQAAMLREMKATLHDFPAQQEKEQQARWKMLMFAKQLGLNLSGLTNEQIEILMQALRQSDKYKQGRRGGRRR